MCADENKQCQCSGAVRYGDGVSWSMPIHSYEHNIFSKLFIGASFNLFAIPKKHFKLFLSHVSQTGLRRSYASIIRSISTPRRLTLPSTTASVSPATRSKPQTRSHIPRSVGQCLPCSALSVVWLSCCWWWPSQSAKCTIIFISERFQFRKLFHFRLESIFILKIHICFNRAMPRYTRIMMWRNKFDGYSMAESTEMNMYVCKDNMADGVGDYGTQDI